MRNRVRTRRHLVDHGPVGLQTLEDRQLFSAVPGFLTTATPYLVPSAPAVEITPLLTVGDSVAESDDPAGTYRMVGIPDGLGAFDNGDGTFTVLMNHEINPTSSNNGIVRDHGAEGSFVSKWVIDKATLNVLEGDDLIKTLYVWDPTANGGDGDFVVGTGALAALNRLCSADLPDVGAFFFDPTPDAPGSGDEVGTTERIFMNGEEADNGRAFANVVTGSDAGSSWELAGLGKFAWENSVASPYAQESTIVMGLDDSSRNFSSEGAADPSEVYVWVGQKQATGSVIEKAGLIDGILHGVRVGLPGGYDANESTVASGERFELVALSDQTANTTFEALQAESIDNSITQFRRVEDGHFDTQDPNVFYFVTTDTFGGSTRLWKMTFDDITNPAAGGVIEIAYDSPAGVPGEMFDNMTVNWEGDVLLQEDPGNNAYLAKVWQFDTATGDLIQVAQHNPALFGAAGLDLLPGIPGTQSTLDEESSGIIDLSHILGKGYYLADVQAHYNYTATTDPTGELVQQGQLLMINTNAVSATLEDGVLTVQGSVNDDSLEVKRTGNDVKVYHNGEVIATVGKKDVKQLNVFGSFGADQIRVDNNVHISALLFGQAGSDTIRSGGAASILIGGDDADSLFGGSHGDILIGGNTSLGLSGLSSALDIWSSGGNYKKRIAALMPSLITSILDDGAIDTLTGGGSLDWFFRGGNDQLADAVNAEAVN